MKILKKIYIKFKPPRHFENCYLLRDIVNMLNDSQNYIQVTVYKNYCELVYWIKDSFSYTKTQNIYYEDYAFKDLEKKEESLFCEYIYNHLNLKDKHQLFFDKHWRIIPYDKK